MTRHCRSRLSQRTLTFLQTGQWCSENLGYGKGSLQVRATPAGVLYHYRSGGERTRIPLGPGSGHRALSLDEARRKSLALAEMTGRGPHVVSVDGGHTALHPSTLWRYVNGVAEELLDQGGVATRFSPADLRHTVETHLAAVKIWPEVRAHLQSHGLSGVQTRHYDRHTYLDEKRDALRRLFRLLSGG